MKTHQTVSALLAERAEELSDKRLYTFLEDGETVGDTITFAQLDSRVRKVGAQIAEGTAVGDRVLLLYEPALDYVIAFFACLYTGRIAVPVYPPNPQRLDQTLPRLMHIVRDADPVMVATTQMIRGLAEGFLTSMGLEDVHWISTDEVEDSIEPAELVALDPSAVAFLQYTSGSTSKPRGVRVTHSNLTHNVELIAQALRADESTVGISWLPFYHDMGLIGKIITPALVGCSAILMSPLDYLRRPARWLEAVTRYGGTVSAAPNFAYDLCVRKVTDEEIAQLDLSSWQVALNGAEPVQADTLQKFSDRFASVGFRPEAFLPAYGLAESTLIVTGATSGVTTFKIDSRALEQGEIEEIESGDRTLVSSGSVPGRGHEVLIVDPESREMLPERNVGEIWVHGPSVADGYWQREELSSKTFKGQLASDDERFFLRTGDLGALVNGELVVTGRRKDLLILRGRNIYPQDLELTVANAHEAVRPGGMVAFSVDEAGGEVAVIVAELERRTRAGVDGDYRRRTETLPEWEVSEAPEVKDVASSIRAAILAEHRVDVAHVVLIKPGSVPKTSSGKIQRHECRRRFLNEELDIVGSFSMEKEDEQVQITEPPIISIEALTFASRDQRVELLQSYLAELAAHIIGCKPEDVGERGLMAAGLDSMKAMEFQYAIEGELGVRLFPSLLLGGVSVHEVAEELADADFQAVALRQGLSEPSSEVFDEPSEGRLTDQVRFAINGTFDADVSNVDERLSFTEDHDPWGPTRTIEFHVDEDNERDLSWNEKGFWLYQQTHPESWAPNIYYAAELPEGVSVEALADAIEIVLTHNPNLRSRYVPIGGTPVRDYDPNVRPPIDVVDARDWTRNDLVDEFERRSARAFNLRQGPLIRFAYLQREGRAILCMTMHHIIVDFWSLEQLIWAIGDAVSGRADETTSVTYVDYVRWQKRLLASDRGTWCEDFWRGEFEGGIPRIELPPSTTSATSGTGYGRPYRAYLEKSLVSQVDAFASENNVTRYTVLLATYQLLLYRWTDQTEFFIGAVAAARTRRFFRDVLGAFSNPLPLRTKVIPSRSFCEHLAATQAKLLRAMDAQEFPLETMLERLDIRRDGIDNPIMQTLFASEQPREGNLEIGASCNGLRTVDLGLAGTIFDFTIMIYEGTNGGELRLQYNDRKYDEATVSRLAAGFRAILAHVVEHPLTRVANVPIIDERERRRLVTAWGQGAEGPAESTSIIDLFEAQAAKTPEQIAATFASGEWTYAVLNQKANAVARELIRHGVKSETPVGVSMQRGPELLATLLGVMKAGAMYVALQPDLPQARLRFMIEDASVKFIVADESGRRSLPEMDLRVLEPDSLLASSETAENPGIVIDKENLAYILYTSGTTGRPKGVAMRHEAVLNLVASLNRRGLFEEGDVVLWKTPYGFDVSVSELFNTLSTGGRLIITETGDEQDPSKLIQKIQRYGVTTLRMVPTALDLLIADPGFELCTTIRRVICAGEALTAEISRRFFEKSQADLYNLLGATETCVDTTFWRCEKVVLGQTQPVGGPLDNYTMRVLSGVLELAPVGVEGDFYVGGSSLARGYVGQPKLTSLRFVPDPQSPARGARLYRTGDRAQWLEGGMLEYLGRSDSQIQVRGIRVEILEVEAILASMPGVLQAAVRSLGEVAGRTDALLAYLVFDGTEEPSTREIREYLLTHLPEAVVPSRFVRLEAMPRTSSGKIDRGALPDPNRRDRVSGIAPSTPLEIRIAEIWDRHLNTGAVGVHENFFEIGGHSLLAVRIQHEIMSSLGVDVPLGTLFDFPTIRRLAVHLSETEEFDFEPIERHAYDDEAPLSSGQRLMWIQQFMQPDAVTYNSPGAFRLQGSLEVDALKRAFTRLVERSEILRTTYPLKEEEPIQKILPPPQEIPWEDLDVREEEDPEEKAADHVVEMVSEPFDLRRDLPFRAATLRVAADEWIFCLVFHHIAFDEWSFDVLLEELAELYFEERGEPTAEDRAQVAAWQQTYQATYRDIMRKLKADELIDPQFNTDGWVSSYDGTAYSYEKMRDWIQGTLEPLRDQPLGRVLEIGCGTGMVLFELADQADEYVGLDFSAPALAYIEAICDQSDQDYSHVELINAEADAVEGIEGEFDTIILNSVVQYFPSHEYLESVLDQACEKLKSGGRIYLGDLRDGRNDFAFHASVVRRNALESTERAELRERALKRYGQDEELTVTPQYLMHRVRGLKKISHADVLIPRAEYDTEMARFRYEVMLYAEPQPKQTLSSEVVTWDELGRDIQGLKSWLEGLKSHASVLSIPNQRTFDDVVFQGWLWDDAEGAHLVEYQGSESVDAVDPERLRVLGESLGYTVSIVASDDVYGAYFDAVFEQDAEPERSRPLTPLTSLASSHAVPMQAPSLPLDELKLWKNLLEAKLEIARNETESGLSPIFEERYQYGDFAIWERSRLKGEDFERGLTYWADSLDGVPLEIQWPSEREASGTFHPADYIERVWSRRSSDRLREFAKTRESSEFLVLYACFTASLGVWTQQEQFVVGVGTTLRQRPEFRNLVGYLLNMLPVAVEFSELDTFEEHFEKVRHAWETSREHQWIPLERIVNKLGAHGQSGHGPLYDVMFTYVPGNFVRRSGSAEAEFERDFAGLGATVFDYGGLPDAVCGLNVSAFKSKGQIATEFEYDAARFDRETIERMIAEFETMAQRFLSMTQTPLGGPLLTERATS